MNHLHGPTCGCKNEKGEPLFIVKPTQETAAAVDYLEAHLSSSLEDLKTLAAIPSVSLDEFGSKPMSLSAEATAELFHRTGLDNVKIMQFGDVHPYIYADWIHKPDRPTLLLYAHHDVQPPGRRDKWDSDPFKPKESQGRLYGRGTADDKAGIIAHTAAIAAYLKTAGELPVNVKILIEGEEETGSTHLAEFVRRYKSSLQADAMVLTDCANIDSGIPSITTALRGLCAIDVEIETMSHPVHSGLWGGILPDPIFALSKILSGLTDEKGHIKVPGIYDDVGPLSSLEKIRLSSLKLESLARKATGLRSELPFTVSERDMAEHLWHAPSLSINAIESGSRKLVSNVIQDGAWARLSVRIVPNMKPEKVVAQMTSYMESLCPPGFRLKVTPQSAGNWWAISNQSDDVYQIAARSLEKGYGRTTQFVGCGASIPFVQPLSDELGGIPAILVGVEDPYTNAHSENESLNLDDFRKTLLGQVYMLGDMAKWRKA